MIIVKIMGGIGNQMAQYSFGQLISESTDSPLLLDKSWFGSQQGKDKRVFSLDYFRISTPHASKLQLAPFQFNALCNKYGKPSFFKGFESYTDSLSRALNYNSLQGIKHGYFDGYWFQLAYLSPMKNTLKRIYLFPTPNHNTMQWLNKIANAKISVAIHIRRGDYVSSKKISNIFGVLPLSYYEQAMALFNKRLSNPHFFLFSNDLSWCRNAFKEDSNITYVDQSSGDMEDLRLMMACNHHIIANSTFSWWGAWLNESTDSITICPKRWYANGMSSRTFIPKNWKQL